MSIPLFFQSVGMVGQPVMLDEVHSRHALQVLRMQAGDKMELTNGYGLLWAATITDAGKKKCIVQIESETKIERGVSRKVGIAISPIKNTGRYEWFLEKATELGVADIFPLLCHRTERAHFRLDRMKQILISAMLQSRQVWLPVLHDPVPFTTLVNNKSETGYRQKLIAHCEYQEKPPLASVIQPHMQDGLLLIGPEGDFTTGEILEATNGGFKAISLGNTRLRTETAGVAGASLMCLL